MVTREELHKLLDQLPESEFDHAYRALMERLAEHDPVLKALLEAPEDDEPTTPEEDQKADMAWQEYLEGKYTTAEEAEREFLS